MTIKYLNFVRNFTATLIHPGRTIGARMKGKQWRSGLLLIVIVISICSFITFPIDRVENTNMIQNSGLADQLTDFELDMFRRSTFTTRIVTSITRALLLCLGIVFGAFFIYLFFVIAKFDGLYVNYFSAFVYASYIDLVLATVIRTVLSVLTHGSVFPFSLSLFSPVRDASSIIFLVLEQFDLFSLWSLFALAAGVAIFSNKRLAATLKPMLTYFIFRSIIFVCFAYLLAKLLGL